MEWLSLPNPVCWQRLIIWLLASALILLVFYVVVRRYWGWAWFRFDSLWMHTVIVVFFIFVLPAVGIVDHYWACLQWFHFEALIDFFDTLPHHEPIILLVAWFGLGVLVGIIIIRRKGKGVNK